MNCSNARICNESWIATFGRSCCRQSTLNTQSQLRVKFHVHACTIYIDGTPTTKRGGVIGVWVYNQLSQKRHMVCVLRKNILCKCGCKGWCTWCVVFRWLEWSFSCMAEGMYPSCKWNGVPYDVVADERRAALAAGRVELKSKAGPIWNKGDWQEYATTRVFSAGSTQNIHAFVVIRIRRDCMTTTSAEHTLRCGGRRASKTIWRHARRRKSK